MSELKIEQDKTPPRVLVVDDQSSMVDLLDAVLSLHQMEVTSCTDPTKVADFLDEENFDVVLTDVRMPGMNGIELCRQIGLRRPNLPVIVMTAFGSMETAVEALRAGAYDFVIKPFDNELLIAAVRRAVTHAQLRDQIRVLRRGSPITQTDLIGTSEAMQRLISQLAKISAADTSVLITGESGTGKELVARTIHFNSERKEGPFIAVNCAALSETLLESELFGHTRGAFTDAREDREGLFLAADGGTLLLDEMGDMPTSLQVKLLRALEERTVRPVGANQEIPFDVRVLAATHRDLESAIEENEFREDLFYRINVISVGLPPLRSRGSDILLIAKHFVRTFAEQSGRNVDGITRPAAEKLLAYSWPGNIRELRNIIERAVVLSATNKVGVEDLPEKVIKHRPTSVFIGGEDPAQLVPLEQIERRYIDHVLAATGGNKTRAAEILGLDRKTLYRKLSSREEST